MPNGSQQANVTLGALLYADRTRSAVAENEWIDLVRSIGAGNQRALRELYGRIGRIVHTLALRITKDAAIANEVLLDVFYDVWRKARAFDPARGSTIAWITHRARVRAICRSASHAHPTSPAHPPFGLTSGYADHEATSDDLWARLSRRIALETGITPLAYRPADWHEPDWSQVAPGTWCKLLATDAERSRVSMLVRLAPEVAYPPHVHAGVEELHLLEGYLWIDGRKLCPGDYNRADAGTADKHVWTETGCSCVLITSTNDVIG